MFHVEQNLKHMNEIQLGLAQGAINAGTGIVGSFVNSLFGDQARQSNFQYNELAAKRADERQRAQWRDMYSISAQMKQLKQNGLSPSLMYGGVPQQGGAGGFISSGGGNVQQPAQQFTPIDIAQLKVSDAQAQALEAQANKDNAIADRNRGIGKMGEVDYDHLFALTGDLRAAKRYKEAQTSLTDLVTSFKEITMNTDLAIKTQELEEQTWRVNNLIIDHLGKDLEIQFSLETWEDRKKTVKETLNSMLKQQELWGANIDVARKTIDVMQSQIDKLEWDKKNGNITTNEMIHMNRKQARKMAQETQKIMNESGLLKKQSDWYTAQQVINSTTAIWNSFNGTLNAVL